MGSRAASEAIRETSIEKVERVETPAKLIGLAKQPVLFQLLDEPA